jgi:hypothetical protein
MAHNHLLSRVAKLVGSFALLLNAACSSADDPSGSVTGTLVRVIVRENDGSTNIQYFVKSKAGLVRLNARSDVLERLTPNSKVTAQGQWSSPDQQELAVEKLSPITSPGKVTQPLSSNAPKGKVAVILVKEPGMPDPFPKQASTTEILTGPNSTNAFFQQVSFGAMGITGDVFGWYTIAQPNCETGSAFSLSDQAQQLAAADGFVSDNYRHAIHIFQRNGGDCFLAAGSFGAPDGVGQIWSYWNNANTMAHEIGHNLGLHHANSYECQGSAFETVTMSSRCRSREYFDPWDSMGFQGYYYHFNSYSKQLQGWIPAARRARVMAPGQFTLVPQETTATSGIQSLLIPIANTNQALHVEMRRQTAPFDNETRFNGAVLVRRVVEPGLYVQSNLIDMTPLDFDPGQASMAVGQVFQDPTSGVAITLVSRNNNQAVVNVAFNAPRCGDGVKNGSESGVDCGGLCGPCPNGQQCSRHRDCADHACQAGVCVASNGGLRGYYFAGSNFDQFVDTRVDKGIDFEWGSGSPMPSLQSDFFSVRWTGKVVPPQTATYTFRTDSDDGLRLWVNNQLIIDRWYDGGFFTEGQISLTAGQQYDIRLEYYEAGDKAYATLAWSTPTMSLDVIPATALIPTPLGACSLGNAVDLGPRNVLTTVPSNACVKVAQYPEWWIWTNGLVTLQSGTGTFPVPATWTDACTNATANFTFSSAWQSRPIGNHTINCPALIKLNGNGSPLQIQWW